MQMKVFLDRYAWKGADLEPGGAALVTGKGHPLRGRVVTVTAVDGYRVRVRAEDGADAEVDRDQLVSLRETSPTQMWERVARAIASVEPTPEARRHWAERFLWALDGFKFVPGGRILAGAGTGKDVTYYNCYVIPSPHDSRKGIVKTLEQMIEIMARGGGVGINGSSLRPRGAQVRGVNGTSSGAVSWMEIYSDATGLIEQGGSRRGALMLMLAAWHPDIEAFVTVKRDLARFNNANLSVIIPDAFMEAVERDADWDLVFPDTDDPDYARLWDGDLAAWRAAGRPVKVYRTVRARQLWDLIVESNWLAGEPGVVFLERYNKLSNTWYFQKLISVNPCFVGSTRLATDKGLLTFEELYHSGESIAVVTDLRAAEEAAKAVGGAGHVLAGVRLRPALPVFKTGENVPVYRLVTTHGYEVTATADHRFLTPSGYVELRRLQPGDVLYLQSGEGAWSRERALPPVERAPAARARPAAHSGRGEASVPTEWSPEIGRFLGWAVAHGCTYEEGGKPRLCLAFGEGERELLPYFRGLVEGWFGVRGTIKRRKNATTLHFAATVAGFARALGVRPVPPTERRVPETLWRAPREAVVGFLQALFTADGTVTWSKVEGSCSVRLASSSQILLQDVQLLLLNLGIVSAVRSRRHTEEKESPEGRCGRQVCPVAEQYELLIERANRDVFNDKVGFLTEAKRRELEAILRSRVRKTEREEFMTRVAEISPAGRADVFDTTEFVTHSLIANGIVAHQCGEQGLPAWGVCNLGSLGLPAFVRDGAVDWDLLRETTRVAVRFLDNVIDETRYVFEENRRSQLSARRVGLGTQGLAHLLIKLKLRYGSPEANAFLEELYRRIMLEAYWASVELAKEKGPFAAFDREKFLQGEFIQRLPEDLREAIARHGIRNATLLTQAPTGTTSLLAGMSSGIEPVFRFKMKRMDRIGEHYLYDPLYKEWEDANPGAERPAWFVEADDLTPEEHVAVQALIQRYVDASISKTVNAPRHHTVEDTRRVYELAWRLGCKGITYFREGSRMGVLAEVKEESAARAEAAAAGGDATGATAATVAGPAGSGAAPVAVAPGAAAATQIPLVPAWGGPREMARCAAGPWGRVKPLERPTRLAGYTDVRETPLGKLFLTLNVLDGHPFELFAQIGKAGSDVAAFTEAVARLVSLALRCGVDPAEVVDQLAGIGGSRSVGFGAQRIRSVPDAIGHFLGEFLNGGGGDREAGGSDEAATAGKGQLSLLPSGNGSPPALPKTAGLCPQCGLWSLVPTEGCATCLNCGFSEC